MLLRIPSYLARQFWFWNSPSANSQYFVMRPYFPLSAPNFHSDRYDYPGHALRSVLSWDKLNAIAMNIIFALLVRLQVQAHEPSWTQFSIQQRPFTRCAYFADLQVSPPILIAQRMTYCRPVHGYGSSFIGRAKITFVSVDPFTLKW